MNKGILTLYIDNELKERAKAKGFNMSSMFNSLLKFELDGVVGEDIEAKNKRLGLDIIRLSCQLEEANKKIGKLRKKLQDLKDKEGGWITT